MAADIDETPVTWKCSQCGALVTGPAEYNGITGVKSWRPGDCPHCATSQADWTVELPLVLFTGSRNWPYYLAVLDAMRHLQATLGPYTVMHGAARGLDTFADIAANVLRLPTDPNPVTRHEWATYGKAAGNRRNSLMLDKRPDYVVAFWTGVRHGPLKSTGTVDTVLKAVNSYRIPVLLYSLK